MLKVFAHQIEGTFRGLAAFNRWGAIPIWRLGVGMESTVPKNSQTEV
jgi:hypothetical protein